MVKFPVGHKFFNNVYPIPLDTCHLYPPSIYTKTHARKKITIVCIRYFALLICACVLVYCDEQSSACAGKEALKTETSTHFKPDFKTKGKDVKPFIQKVIRYFT